MTEYTIWCSGCSSEPAVDVVQVDYLSDGNWIDFPMGKSCLTKLEESGKIEE